MMKTVAAVASARKNASPRCSSSARYASSGPYALEDRPSAPSPTHASSATSESLWKACGSLGSLGGPITTRRTRARSAMVGVCPSSQVKSTLRLHLLGGGVRVLGELGAVTV